jgi:hypothetical protein
MAVKDRKGGVFWWKVWKRHQCTRLIVASTIWFPDGLAAFMSGGSYGSVRCMPCDPNIVWQAMFMGGRCGLSGSAAPQHR